MRRLIFLGVLLIVGAVAILGPWSGIVVWCGGIVCVDRGILTIGWSDSVFGGRSAYENLYAEGRYHWDFSGDESRRFEAETRCALLVTTRPRVVTERRLVCAPNVVAHAQTLVILQCRAWAALLVLLLVYGALVLRRARRVLSVVIAAACTCSVLCLGALAIRGHSTPVSLSCGMASVTADRGAVVLVLSPATRPQQQPQRVAASKRFRYTEQAIETLASWSDETYAGARAPLSGAVVVSGGLAVVAWWLVLRQGRRWRRRSPLVCKTCGYDLRGSPTGVCSECGTLAKQT